ncbi:MAG: hypothetical protein ACI9TH_001048 [Kiritimatiellia bacterium]|jgi:flagellar biosynthesis/type III secretory pathway M-ring protein FliF/YscJ
MSDENEVGHAINPMSSVVSDVKNARRNSGAVAGEVREFLAQMQGRSPQEMLGMIAQSSLIKCTIQAVFVMLAVLVVFTIIPYGLEKLRGGDAAKAKAAPEVAQPVVVPEKPATAASVDAAPATENSDEPDDLLDKLGVGETKVAPAKENPLDGGADDLFKDLQ